MTIIKIPKKKKQEMLMKKDKVGKEEHSFTVVNENANWNYHYRNQYGDSSESEIELLQ